jgi:type I restriction enzyme M protein
VAESKSAKPTKSVEESLWDTAISLRGTVEPSEYKHIVLGLIFLKFASDKFEARRLELIADSKEKYVDQVDFYAMLNVFYLPEECRWQFLISKAKQPDISILIDRALASIENSNPSLLGALPSNYYSSIKLDASKLANLLDALNNIDTLKDPSHDLIGRVYEYFLRRFAIVEGRNKGEFYTPKNVVHLMAELIEPFEGKIYDPCCGSGGMFVQSLRFVEAHQGNSKDIAIYGQEATPTTYKLAKMNLAIRGITADLGEEAADTFSKDQHKHLKADYILANPPFNLGDWRAKDELVDDSRWSGFGVPPASNANYAWILHMISKLSQNGVAGFLLANGALGDPDTKAIRRQILEQDLVEAIITLPRDMFYSTDISVTLWIVNRNKRARNVQLQGRDVCYRDRSGEVFFLDLRRRGIEVDKKYIEFPPDQIAEITRDFRIWRGEVPDLIHSDVPEYCYSAGIEEIRSKDYSLIPSKYIQFLDADLSIDFEQEMAVLRKELSTILKAEADSHVKLTEAFEGLGYGL